MKATSRRDYLQKTYFTSSSWGNSEKGQIWDAFCTNCGYHRKYAIRLLKDAPPEKQAGEAFPPKTQDQLRGVGHLDSGSGVGGGGLSLVAAPEVL